MILYFFVISQSCENFNYNEYLFHININTDIYVNTDIENLNIYM